MPLTPSQDAFRAIFWLRHTVKHTNMTEAEAAEWLRGLGLHISVYREIVKGRVIWTAHSGDISFEWDGGPSE